MSTRPLVLATRNADKVRELGVMFEGLPVGPLHRADQIEGLPEVIEDADTLEGNALKKAREVSLFTGEMCLGDDTGLEVLALEGAPGVYSSRYAGENATYEDNCRKLMDSMRAKTERTAWFTTVMAVVDPHVTVEGKPSEIVVVGRLQGEILEEPRGDQGFGYDPVFFLPEMGLTLAELSVEQKNRISHRGQAGQRMRAMLAVHLGVPLPE